MSANEQATFCATLVDQWIRLGLRHAVVAPGSRSTPMALQLATRGEITVHVVHDERSASFVALGIGLVTALPAALLCTSGTAATHFHAAVVEAGLSNVPVIVLTADRPPELRDVGAPQTIDQTRLYGSAVRWFHDPGVPSGSASATWRSLATRAWSAALGVDHGPVHLNLPFREPLVGAVGELPPVLATGSGATKLAPGSGEAIEACAGRRGVIVAGKGVDDPHWVEALAVALDWPVLADPRSGCRTLPHAVCAFDSILRHQGFAEAHLPEVVLRLGEPPASKVLAQWLVGSGAVQVQVDDSTRVIDPDHVVQHVVTGSIGAVCMRLAARLVAFEPSAPVIVPPPVGWSGDDTNGTAVSWSGSWTRSDRLAQQAIDAATAGPLSEPAVARVLTGVVGSVQHLVVASSMPVRDVEWFGDRCAGITVHSNRGANGIDGVIATAIGVAAGARQRTVALLGDVAFCHDASSLTALAARRLDLTIVVIDNDGGGIFSFLPQADSLDHDRFEQLFGTPHATDVVALATAHGLPAATVTTASELGEWLQRSGTSVVRIASTRAGNVAEHRRLHAAVVHALG
jgi:2-succinyl-5-enolpyruvyl-6-hydroxy-3-cyclohexene-1-carboxylate synthase